MSKPAKRARPVLALALVAALSACSATFTNHGFIPPAEELAEIQVGRDTRATVEETIGTPAASGVIAGDTWFYVASRQRHFAYRAPEVIERDIVAVVFDARGRVENIYELDLQDGEILRLSRRVTSSPIREVTLLRQIAQNFGRVNIADALGAEN